MQRFFKSAVQPYGQMPYSCKGLALLLHLTIHHHAHTVKNRCATQITACVIRLSAAGCLTMATLAWRQASAFLPRLHVLADPRSDEQDKQ